MDNDPDIGDELQLISDSDGLAIIGSPTAIEAFLAAEGLASKDLDIPTLGTVLNAGGAAATAGSELATNSGRWVQLTKESSELVKKYGLRESSKSSLSTGVVKGKKGQIKGFVEFAKRPGSGLTNPSLLAGAGGVMTQMAMQQTIKEITAYLAAIDEKVDDVLRAQKDTVLAEMIGVELVIDDVMTVREQVGRVSEVSWSKIESSHQTIAATQAYALRQLDALAAKLERKSDIGDLAKASRDAEARAREWLAVLARCFQLQDAVAIIELDRVLDASPDELDKHRRGLKAAREKRREVITRATERLLERLDAATSRANAKVLTHPRKSPAIVESANNTAASIVHFRDTLGIETGLRAATTRRWKAAVADTRDNTFEAAARAKDRAGEMAVNVKDKAVEVGSDGAGAARRLGRETRDKAKGVGEKLSNSRARRSQRRT